MNARLLPALLLGFAGATAAYAQDMPQCDTAEGMATVLSVEHQEVEIMSVRDPNNNDLYTVFAQNINKEAPSWTLTVTDPEQVDPTIETCIIDSGLAWSLNAEKEFPKVNYPAGVLKDLNESFMADGCLSEAGFIALAGSESWNGEKVNFMGMREEGFGRLVVSSNPQGEGFVGSIETMQDPTSMHPFATLDGRQYCLAVTGMVEDTHVEELIGKFDEGIGIPENGI